MAHDLGFGQTGQPDRPGSLEPAQPGFEGRWLGQIDARATRRVLVED